MALKETLLKELDLYLKGESFSREKTLINIRNLVCYKPELEDEIKTILLNHRISKGMYFKGFKLFFDVDTMDIKIKDIHVVNILVKNSRNSPQAIMTFTNNIYKVVMCGKTYFAKCDSDGKVVDPIVLRTNAMNLENCMYHAQCYVVGNSNPIESDYEMIRFDPNSIETFYSCEDKPFVNFTPAVVNRIWNSGMTVKRHDVNLETHSNGWGLIFPVWSDTLLEVYAGAAYIGDDITEQELNSIIKGHEDSWVAEDMKRKFKANNNNDEADKEEKKKKISDIIAAYQKVIDENEEFIIDETIKASGYNLDVFSEINNSVQRLNAKKNLLAKIESQYGLDCGFLYFRFSDKDISNLAKEVSAYGMQSVYSDGTFTLNIPYDNQSTTMKSREAKIIKDLIVKANLSPISFKTVLD